MSTDRDMNKRTVGLALGLVFLAGVYRVVSAAYLTALPNFSPAMAMAFCCGMALPGMMAFWAPLLTLFVSDLVLNAHFGQPLVGAGMIGVYGCYAVAVALGERLRHGGLRAIVGATLANATLFYLVTNTMAWWANPHYAQTASGWAQALTVGRPGFAPTWMFFRNSLISDAIFTAAFVGLLYWARNRSAAPNLARQEISL